jgi:hypothetical protein
MPEGSRFDISKLSPEDGQGLAELKSQLSERLSPEDRKRLAELIARFKERWRELGFDRTMTTRELLMKYPEIAAVRPGRVDRAGEQPPVSDAMGHGMSS